MPQHGTNRDGVIVDRPLLIRLYHEQLARPGGLAVDKLAYTQEFDDIVTQYNARHTRNPASHYEIFQTLMILRKNSKLVRKGTTDQTTLF